MRPAQIRAMNSQKDIPGMAIVAVKLVVLLSSVALANYACQLALHPLYGSIPTSFHFASATLVSCMLSSTLPIRPYPAFLTLATVLCAAPFTAFKLGSYTARFHNPTWGPVATQIGLAIPITVAAAGLSRHWIVRGVLVAECSFTDNSSCS